MITVDPYKKRMFALISYQPSSVMSHKNVTKVVWYILVQLSSLNNTMTMVSGVSVQVSGFWSLATGHWLLARSDKPAAKTLKPACAPET
jgi:hypothetical protein